MTLSLRFVVLVAVAGICGYVAGFWLMSVLNEIATGLSHGGGSVAADARAAVTTGLIVGGLLASVTGVLGAFLGANRGGRRIHVFGVVGTVAVVVLVVMAGRYVAQRRAETAKNTTASDQVRRRGMEAFGVARSLGSWPRGEEALAAVVRDPIASPEAKLTAGLALLEAGSAPADVEAIVDDLVRTPGPPRLAAMKHFGGWSTPIGYPDGRIGRWVGAALRDPDKDVRAAAFAALGRASWDRRQHGEPCALLGELARDADPERRSESLSALGVCPPDAIAAHVTARLRDVDPGVRRDAVNQLVSLGDSHPVRATRVSLLASMLGDGDGSVREAAESQLGMLRLGSPVPEERAYRLSVVKTLLADADAQVRLAAIEEIGAFAEPRIPAVERDAGLALLLSRTSDPDSRVRAAALTHVVALRRIAEPHSSRAPD